MMSINVAWLNLKQEITISDKELIKYINSLPDDDRMYILQKIDVPDYKIEKLNKYLAAIITQIFDSEPTALQAAVLKTYLSEKAKDFEKYIKKLKSR